MARTQMQGNQVFNTKIKTINLFLNKSHPEGEKQAGRHRTVCSVNIICTQRKTMDQYSITDTRRLYRETNEGNEGDTGGATETMIG